MGQRAEAAGRFGVPVPGTPAAAATSDADIPRPPHWGGYRLWLDAVELWVEGSQGRIHDRARWSRSLQNATGAAFEPSAWRVTRLQP